jgi:hypothetical protein
VLTGTASALRPPDLVTVNGAIILFSFADLAARHELADAGSYAVFEGRKALEAPDVRSWAEASP